MKAERYLNDLRSLPFAISLRQRADLTDNCCWLFARFQYMFIVVSNRIASSGWANNAVMRTSSNRPRVNTWSQRRSSRHKRTIIGDELNGSDLSFTIYRDAVSLQ